MYFSNKLYLILSYLNNHKYKETDSIHSLQFSLKSYPLWVTLYVKRIISLHKMVFKLLVKLFDL